MGISTLHGLHAVKLNTSIIGGITGYDGDINLELDNETTNSSVWSEFQAVRSITPTFGYRTYDVADMLDEFTNSILPTAISGISGGVVMYQQKYANGGTRATGSNHRTLTINDGMIYPVSLTCDHQGDAVLTVGIAVTYNGTNELIIPAGSAALAAGTDTQRYTLGSITIESVGIAQIKSLNIDFGIEPSQDSSDSDVRPTHSHVKRQMPKITLTTTDVTKFATSSAIDVTGLAATHANSAIYLRKRSAGGLFVADETTEHIEITVAGHTKIMNPMNAETNEPGEMTIEIEPYYDGTNNPLVVDTTAALP